MMSNALSLALTSNLYAAIGSNAQTKQTQTTDQLFDEAHSHYSSTEKRAIVLYKQGNYELAQNIIEEDLRLPKASSRVRKLNLVAICLYKRGKIARSNKVFQEVEEECTRAAKSHGNLDSKSLVISACHLKIMLQHLPEAVLLKHYPWMKTGMQDFRRDLLDQINVILIVPKESFEQSLG